MLRGRCHAGGYSQADRPEPSAWNLRPDPAAFHAPAYPIPEKKRSALQMLPLALAGDPAQYHTGTHWRYRGVSRYPGDLIWPLCAVC